MEIFYKNLSPYGLVQIEFWQSFSITEAISRWTVQEEIYFIYNTKRSEEVPLMTTMIKNHIPVQVPAGTGKKTRAAKKKPAVKGFFGLLPDWEIDTQAFRDELRD